MTRLLITGASGLLGANLVMVAEHTVDVIAVVHTQQITFSRAQTAREDLTDPNSVRKLFEECRPDWVIHCAADTAIDDLEANPDRATKLNTEMAREVAKAAVAAQSRLIFVSTDSVFDGRDGPYQENDRPVPLNVYARSKLEGELAVADEHPDALIVRTNLFGWSPGSKQSLAEWFYSKLAAGESCMGFTDIYFSPVYAPELASIFIKMLDHAPAGLYHVPGDECLSKFEFGRRVAQTFGFDTELIKATQSNQIDWKADRPKMTCLNGSNFMQALDISLPSLGEGLARFQRDHDNGMLESFQVAPNLEELDA
jgi:dTDP-4-dehydrorhamnose reductase